jgi:hypothetical protein
MGRRQRTTTATSSKREVSTARISIVPAAEGDDRQGWMGVVSLPSLARPHEGR